MSEYVSIEITDISNNDISNNDLLNLSNDLSNNLSNNLSNDLSDNLSNDISNIKVQQKARKMSVFKKFNYFIKKKERHNKKRGFNKWKKHSDLKGKPRLLLYKENKKCSGIEEVNYDFDYEHSITANGNYYNYVE